MLPGWREVPVDIVKTVGETELQNFVKFKEEMVGVQVVDCENIWLLNIYFFFFLKQICNLSLLIN